MWAPGPVWMETENLATTGIRHLDCPVCSGSLHSIKIGGNSFESAAELKYCCNPNKPSCVHEEMKGGLNSGNAGCRFVENLYVLQFAFQKCEY
jgi:hypothetical protein